MHSKMALKIATGYKWAYEH